MRRLVFIASALGGVACLALLALAGALGVGLGVMGESQDQLMFGILALFLAAVAVVVVVREGKGWEPISEGD